MVTDDKDDQFSNSGKEKLEKVSFLFSSYLSCINLLLS